MEAEVADMKKAVDLTTDDKRKLDAELKDLSGKNMARTFHFKFNRKKKERVISAVAIREDIHLAASELRIGFAYCDDRDQFSRFEGRIIAFGRATAAVESIEGEVTEMPFSGYSMRDVIDAYNSLPLDKKPEKFRRTYISVQAVVKTNS